MKSLLPLITEILLPGALVLAAGEVRADATWVGARFDLDADWSAAENRDGAVRICFARGLTVLIR